MNESITLTKERFLMILERAIEKEFKDCFDRAKYVKTVWHNEKYRQKRNYKKNYLYTEE